MCRFIVIQSVARASPIRNLDKPKTKLKRTAYSRQSSKHLSMGQEGKKVRIIRQGAKPRKGPMGGGVGGQATGFLRFCRVKMKFSKLDCCNISS